MKDIKFCVNCKWMLPLYGDKIYVCGHPDMRDLVDGTFNTLCKHSRMLECGENANWFSPKDEVSDNKK